MSSYRFSKKVAFRYLFSKRSEAFISIITFISIAGVAIGVMVLTMAMAIMNGFENVMREAIIGTSSHVVVRSVNGSISDWESTSRRIRQVRGVEHVSAYTLSQAILRSETASTGLLIRGLEKGSESARQLEVIMPAGQKIAPLFDPQPLELRGIDGETDHVNLPGIVIGQSVARSLGLYSRSPVSLLSPEVASSPFGLVPKFRRFIVAGTFSSNFVELESSMAYVDLLQAQQFFNLGGTVSGLEVLVDDIYSAPQIARDIVDSLGGTGSGFYAQDWTETNRALWEAIELEKKVYFVVLLLIIVMASFSIITTLIMIVLEKRKDIAIMKTMGASTRSIGNIFRIQGAFIGAIGTILGMLGGYLGSLALRQYGFPLPEGVFPVSTVPVVIEPLMFLLVGGAAFAICCVATIYPAHRASNLNPVESLRFD